MADRKTNQPKSGQREKPAPRRRMLLFPLTLIVVLLVVLIAAWRDGTGFDVLRRYLSYGRAETGGIQYSYPASSKNRCAVLGDSLAVVSDTSLRVLGRGNEEVWSAQVSMTNPAIVQGGGRAAAYDIGGTELYVLDQSGERLHLTADEEEPFIAATLNSRGMLAVTSETKGAKGFVTVYGENLERLFGFRSTHRFVMDAWVTNNGKYLAAVTLGQEDGVFVSSIVLYDLSKDDAPIARYDVPDGLVLAIGEQEDLVATVSDTGLTYATAAGKVAAAYSYGGAYLRDYDLGGDGFTALLLNRYQSGNVGRLATVGPDGAELGSLDIREEVRSISAAGRYLAVLYTDSLVVYNQDLQVYAALRGVNASGVLMRQDGSALLLSSDAAVLFLP